MEPAPLPNQPKNLWPTIRLTLYILGALLMFLFSLDLMVSSLQHLGKLATETILLATSNPFTGLFIGLLVAAMLQSSSATTSMIVALVASGSITLQSAVPIIMGANVGTTITSTIVSLGFINKKKEFRRAVAAGTYHDFFNILTVIVLFPLEYYYEFLSTVSSNIANYFFTTSAGQVQNKVTHLWQGFDPIIAMLQQIIPNAFVLALLALVLLFGSILIFRRLISSLLKAKSPEAFSRFFFKNQLKSFGWGLVTTAAIRSSTITTSVVVPIVAKKIASLKQAAPFIMGANIGTTITAFIAVTLNSNTSGAISIAICHFLFNFIGVLLFFPVPVLRKLPISLANGLGKLTLKYRLSGLVYLLVTFFFIPFSLIYLNRDSNQTLYLTYEQIDSAQQKSFSRIVANINKRTQAGEWTTFAGSEKKPGEEPLIIYPVSVKNTTLFIGKRMFLFNRPGFCWDGENEFGKYKTCVDKILSKASFANRTFDSVFVFKRTYVLNPDSISHFYYLSAPYKITLQHEIISGNSQTEILEKLISFEQE
ncbi:MAG TPA: Na/Pi symporter [Chryseolinea sp.]|nr:Na/Pi symporter [Chryseolinea sp.]